MQTRLRLSMRQLTAPLQPRAKRTHTVSAPALPAAGVACSSNTLSRALGEWFAMPAYRPVESCTNPITDRIRPC